MSMSEPVDPGGLEPHEHNYEMVMPFVCCESEGGAYDDTAFAAGCQFGQLATALANGISMDGQSVPVYPELAAQVDLLAMQHGYSTTAEPWDEDPERWVMVAFSVIGGKE